MRKVFIGLLFVFINFSINDLNLTPAFVGYILIYLGLGEVEECPSTQTSRMIAAVGAVVDGVLWVLGAFGAGLPIPLGAVFQLLVTYRLVVWAEELASLRSFYNYYYRNELIENNPAVLVPLPKLHDKEIIRMDPNEVAVLLDEVEDGGRLTKNEQRYHNKTKTRDLALLTLLLGTGIRVSECVGLDIQDVDFDNQRLKVRRKGGYEDIVYFGEEVEDALYDYLEERERIIPLSGHENAFFLSMQNRRITVRSVENLVKKYASRVTTLKKITPHKLRSTYGTTLYQETGDIYLVADVLGHKDVNTTRKHYAAMQDENKRKAAKAVKLREP